MTKFQIFISQVLKRKEREYEHEMERLAKEKISSQNRILVLKRELSQWGDVDFSRLAPDTDAIPTASNGSATPSERGQNLLLGWRIALKLLIWVLIVCLQIC